MANNKQTSIIVNRVMQILDRQMGTNRRPWRSTRFNNLYAPIDDLEVISSWTCKFGYYFSMGSMKFRTDGANNPEDYMELSLTRREAYVYMFRCLVYTCSLMYTPWNAWLVLWQLEDPENPNSNLKKIDETKRMLTYIRRILAMNYTQQMAELGDLLPSGTSFIDDLSSFVFDKGPVYNADLNRMIMIPVPSRDEVRAELKAIISGDGRLAPVEHPKYIIVPEKLQFSNSDATQEGDPGLMLDVRSNVVWGAVSSDSVNCQVSPTGGVGNGQTYLKVTENTDTVNSRTFTITVSDNTPGATERADTKTVTVIQPKKIVIPPVLKCDVEWVEGEQYIEQNSDGGKVTFVLTANVSWGVTGTVPDWVTVNPRSGSKNSYVSLTFTKNLDPLNREFYLVISDTRSGDVSDRQPDIRIHVKQQASAEVQHLIIEPTEVEIPGTNALSGFQLTTVPEGLAWKLSHSTHIHLMDSADKKGTGSRYISFRADTNKGDDAREMYITIKEDEWKQEVTLKVIQHGAGDVKTITVSPTSVELDENEQTFTINIESNTKWKIIKFADTYSTVRSITPDTGEGDASDIEVKVNANSYADARQALLQVYSTEGSAESVYVDITQAGQDRTPAIELDRTEITGISKDGTTQTVNATIKYIYHWTTVNPTPEWVTVPEGGYGSQYSVVTSAVNVRVEPNPNSGERSTNIDFYNSDVTPATKLATLSLKQVGTGETHAITITPTVVDHDYTAALSTDCVVLNYTATDSWSANVNTGSDWCTIGTPQTGGPGNGEMWIFFPENDTGSPRTATIQVWSEYNSVTVTINQAAQS